MLRAKRHARQVAHQKAIRAVFGHRAEDSDFARLLNPRCRKIDRRVLSMRIFDCSRKAADVLKIYYKIGNADMCGAPQLFERPTKHSQRRRCCAVIVTSSADSPRLG